MKKQLSKYKELKKELKEELTEFFLDMVGSKEYVICEECGRKIYNPGREVVAHIIPKSIFKSVATNGLNTLYLCLQHHSQFDSSYKKAMEMQCWNKALFKYKLFKDKITEEHRILDYFKEEEEEEEKEEKENGNK